MTSLFDKVLTVAVLTGACGLMYGGYLVLSKGLELRSSQTSTVLNLSGTEIAIEVSDALIAFGGVAILLGFMGFWGAGNDETCCLQMFNVGLLVFIVGQIIIAGYCLTMDATTENILLKSLEDHIKKTMANPADTLSNDLLKFFNQKMECCGLGSGNNGAYSSTSCCSNQEKIDCLADEHEVRGESCIDALIKFISENEHEIFKYGGLGLAAQVVLLLVSHHLHKAISPSLIIEKLE